MLKINYRERRSQNHAASLPAGRGILEGWFFQTPTRAQLKSLPISREASKSIVNLNYEKPPEPNSVKKNPKNSFVFGKFFILVGLYQ